MLLPEIWQSSNLRTGRFLQSDRCVDFRIVTDVRICTSVYVVVQESRWVRSSVLLVALAVTASLPTPDLVWSVRGTRNPIQRARMLDSAQGALEIRVFGFPQFWGVYSRPGSQKDKPSEQARNGQFVALNKEGVDFSIAQSVADSKSIRTRWSGRLPHSVFTVSDPNRSATAESEEQPSHAGGLD